MYPTESFEFWWLFPILMILSCLFMRLSKRRRGMAGCCMGWGGSRDRSRNRRSEDGVDRGRSADTATPAEGKDEAEKLKRTFDRLERRLQNLEAAVTSKEFDWNQRLNQS